jgi:hypothetical protein
MSHAAQAAVHGLWPPDDGCPIGMGQSLHSQAYAQHWHANLSGDNVN